jgi:hypothetical protein
MGTGKLLGTGFGESSRRSKQKQRQREERAVWSVAMTAATPDAAAPLAKLPTAVLVELAAVPVMETDKARQFISAQLLVSPNN